MGDFKKMIVDNKIFKILILCISILSILGILFNSHGISPFLFLYVPMSILYSDMYKKNKLSTNGKKASITLNTIIYVLSYPGLLLFLLVKLTFKCILSVASITTPKFGGKGKYKW